MFFETIRDQKLYFLRADNVCMPHFHRSSEILYVLSGKKTVFLNGEKKELFAGDVLFCPPYLVHKFVKSEDSEQIVATIAAEFCPQFTQFCRANVPDSYVIRDEDGSILKLVSALENPKNEMLFLGAANTLLGVYAERVHFTPAANMPERTLIERIAEYIDQNYASPLTLASLADTFGYSPNYFSTLFKRYFGTGVPQYINYTRVRKSLKLLRTQKISTVYFSVGFQSPQQYFLNFKKYYGCSPKEYLSPKSKPTR